MGDSADRCFRVVVCAAEGAQRKPLQEEALPRVAVVAQPIPGLDCLNDPPSAAAVPHDCTVSRVLVCERAVSAAKHELTDHRRLCQNRQPNSIAPKAERPSTPGSGMAIPENCME